MLRCRSLSSAAAKRVDGDEPQMRYARLEHETGRTLLFNPVEELLNFPAEE